MESFPLPDGIVLTKGATFWTVHIPQSCCAHGTTRLREPINAVAILLARMSHAADGIAVSVPTLGAIKAVVGGGQPVTLKSVLPAGTAFASLLAQMVTADVVELTDEDRAMYTITRDGRKMVRYFNEGAASSPTRAQPTTSAAATSSPAVASFPSPARAQPMTPTAAPSAPGPTTPHRPGKNAHTAADPSAWEATPVALLPTTLEAQVSDLADGVSSLTVTAAATAPAPATLKDFLFPALTLADGQHSARPLLDDSMLGAAYRGGAYGLLGQLVPSAPPLPPLLPPPLPISFSSPPPPPPPLPLPSPPTLVSSANGQGVYLGVSDPFCMVAVGVQGAGKSHSLNVILENCLVHCPPYIQADPPLTTLVFHFDPSPFNFCEAVGLSARNPLVPRTSAVGLVHETVILVSPSYYKSRKAYYANRPGTVVEPLLFCWDQLTAEFIKSLMRVEESDSMPLYMAAILDMLRKMQKEDKHLSLAGFKQMIEDARFSPGQTTGLMQRLQLLESLVAESAENVAAFKGDAAGVRDVSAILHAASASSSASSAAATAKRRRLVVVDLTDPMMSGPEANGIFQVVLSMFLAVPASKGSGKIVVFDEAHKYIQPGVNDPLSARVVSIVRQMRHHGIRIAISTQSPKAIPPELLELCTVALLHRFQSHEWFTYLRGKLPLEDSHLDRIMALPTGNALVFCLAWPAGLEAAAAPGTPPYVREVRIRPRLTTDMGMSKVHSSE